MENSIEKINTKNSKSLNKGILSEGPNLLKKTIGAVFVIFIIVFIYFMCLPEKANVVVEINEIPNNWLVTTYIQDENSNVECGLRATVRSEFVNCILNRECIIFSSNDPYNEYSDCSGTFVVNGNIYTNATLHIEPVSGASLIENSFVYGYTQPIIKVESVNSTLQLVEMDLTTAFSSLSVEQHISADFNLFKFEFLASGNSNDSTYDNTKPIGRSVITVNSDILLSFEECNAYIVDANGKKIQVNECEFHPSKNQSSLVIASIDKSLEDVYYRIEIPRESDFSISSSEFTESRLYGVGRLYFAYTANGKEYKLLDQEVVLQREDISSEKQSMYTFEHSYFNESENEDNMFRMNAYVNSASIDGESIMPNFWTWFRDLYNDPLSILDSTASFLAGGGTVYIMLFIGNRVKRKKHSYESEKRS